MKVYNFNGYAGCVVQRKSRKTKTLVGIYHGLQSGIEADPELPWVTVCEVHNTLVCYPSLAAAKMTAPDPTEWCEECRG